MCTTGITIGDVVDGASNFASFTVIDGDTVISGEGLAGTNGIVNANGAHGDVENTYIAGTAIGVHYTQGKWNKIGHSMIESTGVSGAICVWYDRIYSDLDSVLSDTIFSDALDGVYVSAEKIELRGLTFSGVTNKLTIAAAGINSVKIFSCPDFVTDNEGITSSITSPITVTHGLAVTPTCVTISTVGGSSDGYVSTVGATTFQIVFTGGGSKQFYWHAIYQP
jgi:hypothetical protein